MWIRKDKNTVEMVCDASIPCQQIFDNEYYYLIRADYEPELDKWIAEYKKEL